ncbi:MAG TPA: ABC transporter ATP-binding protein [Roseiflexaceae bacterium]|nr:ABC transporter ATP-binding protein [Roseiflexaceae bacterium]
MVVFGPKTPEWRDIRAATRTIPKAFKLLWSAHPRGTIGMAVVTLIGALLPASQAWVGKLIIDGVVLSTTQQLPPEQSLNTVLPFLLLEFVLIMIGLVVNETRTMLQRVLNSRLKHRMSTAIVEQAIDLDLHYFENAAYYDKLQNARQELNFRAMTILETSFLLTQHIVTIGTVLVIMLSFNPLLALILIFAAIPALIAQLRYGDMSFMVETMRAPESRRMAYFEHLLTVDTSAKEVKLFGLGRPLLQRYNALFEKFYLQDRDLARWRGSRSILWGMLTNASYYLAYGWIIWRTVTGTMTLGDLTLYLTLFRQSQMSVQQMFGSIGQIYESGRFMDNLFSFLALKNQSTGQTKALPVPQPIRQGIEFRNVSFRYPSRNYWALRNINLHIEPGEKVAIVGTNGAGKTTLVKLLTRLYDPTEGQILLDGVDIRDYNLAELRQRIGVIFQDFVRYHTTLQENIGFGQIDALDDLTRIDRAAERGGADELIGKLPDGYQTMLGAWFEKGHELSGGQWQKIALSRAFMRDGEVLVLDEPTSALDAEREYEIFQRFRELTEGKIALLISHRFSTVRMADQIIVIENGELIEQGSHDDLLLRDGTYARLFNLQAAGYR